VLLVGTLLVAQIAGEVWCHIATELLCWCVVEVQYFRKKQALPEKNGQHKASLAKCVNVVSSISINDFPP